MKYGILNPTYSLRGWIGRPFNLVKGSEVRHLEKQDFDVLILCDGQTDLDALGSENSMINALRSFEEEGVVSFSDAPRSLSPEQYYQHLDTRYMHSCYWSVTGRCNYRCRHCYINSPDAMMGEMSTEEAFSVIDQMAACNIYHVYLSGGEPFVRRDFWQLVDRLRERQISIDQVYTNGWLLTESVLDEFESRDLRPEFSISFDGVGWHDWMRGVKGAEEAALRALRLCRDRGFPTDVEMCVHKGNTGVIRDSVLCLAETGTRSIKCSNVVNTELWAANAEGNALSDEEYFDAVLAYLPYYFKDGMPVNLLFSGVVKLTKGSTEYWAVAEFDEGTEASLKRHLCGAIRNSCYIAPDGRLLPCMPMASVPEQMLFPKIQDIGLKQALKDSFYMDFIDRRVCDLKEACRTCRECPYLLRCGGGCRAAAAMRGEKNLMGPDPAVCLMWKGGYLQKVHAVCDAAIAEYSGSRRREPTGL